MKRLLIAAAVLAGLATVNAQTGAMIRGTVIDGGGHPVPGVKVEIQFQGTPDLKPKTYTQTTNNRGYFARVGLPDGPYKLVFTKEGFDPSTISTSISLGGLSDLGTVPLRASRTAANPAAGGAATPAPVAAGAAGSAPGGAVADPAALANVQDQIRKAYQQATDAINAGNYDLAESLFKDIIAKAPKLAAAHSSLGYVYRERKDYAAAEESYLRAIELQPENGNTYLSLAFVQQVEGNTDKAIETLAAASPRFATDAKFTYTSALLYYDWGKGDEAAAAFKQVLTLDAANAEPLYYLGVLAVQKNQPQEAVPYLERYVAASGQTPKNLQTAQGLLKALKKEP